MSSHHIIREKQEPALLVLGIDGFTDELLGQLLEWSPTVIVNADTAEQLNAYGIKFDVLIGDATDDMQEDIKLISRQGETDVEAALKYLVANGYPAVNVVCDELEIGQYLAYADRVNIVLFNAGKKIYPVSSGFTKWKPAGELIEVLSVGADLTCTGLESIGESQYRTAKDGLFTLQFCAPFIFIAEDIA